MLSCQLKSNTSVWKKDTEGRILRVLLKIGSCSINPVNVYTPTVPADRKAFYQSVQLYFIPPSELDGSPDKFGGNVLVTSDLSDFKSSLSLRDAWRAFHPKSVYMV